MGIPLCTVNDALVALLNKNKGLEATIKFMQSDDPRGMSDTSAPVYRCANCGCPLLDHEVDDEERRGCTKCECKQYIHGGNDEQTQLDR